MKTVKQLLSGDGDLRPITLVFDDDRKMFRETIDQYVYDNHYDDELDDIAADWSNLSLEDQVKKIYEELQEEKK